MLSTTQHRLADEFGRIQQTQSHAGIPAFWCGTPVETPAHGASSWRLVRSAVPSAATPVTPPVQNPEVSP